MICYEKRPPSGGLSFSTISAFEYSLFMKSALKGLTSVFGMEQGEPPTTASGWNLVGGEVNRKGVSSPVGSHDY